MTSTSFIQEKFALSICRHIEVSIESNFEVLKNWKWRVFASDPANSYPPQFLHRDQTQDACAVPTTILQRHSRPQSCDPFGQRHGSRALAGSEAGSHGLLAFCAASEISQLSIRGAGQKDRSSGDENVTKENNTDRSMLRMYSEWSNCHAENFAGVFTRTSHS